MSLRNFFLRLVMVASLWTVAADGAVAGVDSGMTVRAVLIWGTDGVRPDDPKLKDLDVDTREKLKAVFKWKHYYEVDRKEITLSGNAVKKVRLSPRCELSLQVLAKSTVEVRLYGEGKLVVRKRQVMAEDELLVLAGEDKNDTAWFVALSRRGEK